MAPRMANGHTPARKRRLMAGAALATSVVIGGYARRAYANCAGTGGTYTCSEATTTTQTLTGDPLVVTTEPGFGIDTTVSGGDALDLQGTGGLAFTDDNRSPITGSTSGIYARNYGSGALSITTTGTVTGRTGDGISLGNHGTDLTVAAADVSGWRNGIAAFNFGSGALSITATGTVRGESSGGIMARNWYDTTTDLTIAAVDVNGVSARNHGSGTLSITITGAATGSLSATNFGTDLTVAAAAVTGNYNGIGANNSGSGALSITATGAVTGLTNSGIDARNDGTDLTVAAADVSGWRYGIYARNRGSGALSISAGTVTTRTHDGIYAVNEGTDLTIKAAEVSGGYRGIFAVNGGTGALSITTTGTVSGLDGIDAWNGYEATDLTITTAGVSGMRRGIGAVNSGSGTFSITATGAVTGGTQNGLYADNRGGPDLTIKVADVSGTGSRGGIYARNSRGVLSITATGAVTGGTGSGILARNYHYSADRHSTDLAIAAIDVSGGRDGIYASNSGSGALSITTTGVVEGSSHDGIYARNRHYGTDLTIAAADVSGGLNGIFARNDGNGALAITATGTVEGAGTYGIYALNYGTGLTIAAADVSGGGWGIHAENDGSGALSITATGTVTSDSTDYFSAGIRARNYGTDLTIRATDVSGGRHGINASNGGSGALSITATGTVTGEDSYGSGIRASNRGTDLTIAAVDVSGGRHGITAIGSDRGLVSIITTGTVTGTSGHGIDAVGYTGLTVNAVGIISGGLDGIQGQNLGSGMLSITAAGTVTGERIGIYTIDDGSGQTIMAADVIGGEAGIAALTVDFSGVLDSDLTIMAANVSGGREGIWARNSDTGGLAITATGMVTGAEGDGIYALGSGTDLTIAAAEVSGGRHGIHALNYGSGVLSITASGPVTGTNGDGIRALGSGTDLTVAAADVSGGRNGIFASNEGSGALSITTTGTVTGKDSTGFSAGIRADNYGTDLTIGAADVSGGSLGIWASNNRSGALSITATGTVTGEVWDGILARNHGTDLTIGAADVGGGRWGIYATNFGSGELAITATGTVTGEDDDGIYARNYGTDLTIAAADVSGGRNGIRAFNYGGGALSITATGTVTSDSTSFRSAGIHAQNFGTDLTIEAVDVTGSRGIYALNDGTGALTITTTGTVTGGIGDNYGRLLRSGVIAVNRGRGALSISALGTVAGRTSGIVAINYGSDLTIAAIDAGGERYGIGAAHRGTGSLSITTSGAVTGSEGSGIYAWNYSANETSTTTVTVEAGSTVSGATDGINFHSDTGRQATLVNAGSITGAIGVSVSGGPAMTSNTGDITGSGEAAIDLRAAVGPSTIDQHGGAITGDILLSPAADSVNIMGGTVAGDILGQGNATLNFALGSGTFTFGAPFTIAGMSRVNVNSGTAIIAGTIETGLLTVHDGGRLGGTGTVGNTLIAAGGTIVPGTSPGTLTIAGDITFAAGSIYEAEITPALASDLIDASGTATIEGGSVEVMAAPGAYRPGSQWTILSADGGVTGTFDTLVVDPAIAAMPFVDLSLGYDPTRVYLELARNAVAFCDVAASGNQCAAGAGIESLGFGNPVYDALAAVPDEASARRAFEQLSGEVHASIKAALLEDSRFVREAAISRVRVAFNGVGAAPQPAESLGSNGTEPTSAASDGVAAWGQAFGSWGKWDSDGNAAELERSIGGGFIGVDAPLGDWRVGVLAGYSQASFDVDDRASSGSSDNYHIGLYAGTQWGSLGLRLGAAHSWHAIETNRSITFAGFAEDADASYDARTLQAFGEFGYRLDHGTFAFEPFANLAYVAVRTDDFAEDGGAAALSGRRSTSDAAFSTLGTRASTRFMLGGTEATLRAMAGWRHVFGDVIPFSTHAFAGGDAFGIASVPIARDAAVIEAGLDAALSRNASLGLSYQGQFGGGATQNSIKGSLSIRF